MTLLIVPEKVLYQVKNLAVLLTSFLLSPCRRRRLFAPRYTTGLYIQARRRVLYGYARWRDMFQTRLVCFSSIIRNYAIVHGNDWLFRLARDETRPHGRSQYARGTLVRISPPSRWTQCRCFRVPSVGLYVFSLHSRTRDSHFLDASPFGSLDGLL